MKVRCSLWLLVLVCGSPLAAFDLSVGPKLVVPVGDSRQWFSSGGALGVTLISPGRSGWELDAGWDFVEVPDTGNSGVLLGVARLGPVVVIPGGEAWSWSLGGTTGIFNAWRPNLTSGVTGLWLGVDIGLRWWLSPDLAFGLGVGFAQATGLFQAVTGSATFVVRGA